MPRCILSLFVLVISFFGSSFLSPALAQESNGFLVEIMAEAVALPGYHAAMTSDERNGVEYDTCAAHLSQTRAAAQFSHDVSTKLRYLPLANLTDQRILGHTAYVGLYDQQKKLVPDTCYTIVIDHAGKYVYRTRDYLRPDGTPGKKSPMQAEHTRISEEMRKLASRNAWPAVEASFQLLKELEERGEVLTYKEFMLGAEAARALGDITSSRARVAMAAKLDPTKEALDWLGDVDANYGQVKIVFADDYAGNRTLVPTVPPFAPDQRASLAFVTAVIEHGDYEGLLPKGEYNIGDQTVTVLTGDKLAELRVGFPPPDSAPLKSHLTISYNVAGLFQVPASDQRLNLVGLGLRGGARFGLDGNTWFDLSGHFVWTQDRVANQPTLDFAAGPGVMYVVSLKESAHLALQANLLAGMGVLPMGCSLNSTATRVEDLNVVCGANESGFSNLHHAPWFGPSVRLMPGLSEKRLGVRLALGVDLQIYHFGGDQQMTITQGHDELQQIPFQAPTFWVRPLPSIGVEFYWQ